MYAISSIHISACREVVSATWIHDLLVVTKKPYSCIKAHHFITYFLFKKLIFTDKKKIFVYIGTYEFQYMYLEVRLVVSYYKMWVVELLESISVSSLIQIFWTPMVICQWSFGYDTSFLEGTRLARIWHMYVYRLVVSLSMIQDWSWWTGEVT